METRTPWFSDDNYMLSYEKIDGHVFVHIVIDKMTKAVLRDINQKWNDFRLRLYSLGYEHVFTYTDDMRIPKLVDGDPQVVGEWKGKKVVSWELN